MRFKPIILSGLLINLLPFFVQAALIPCGTEANPTPCTIGCFFVMIEGIINFLLWNISIPLAVTGFMVAGIYLIFGSSEQAVTRGKAIFKFTFIGILIAFAAWVIIDTILRGLLDPNVIGPWNQFPGSC